MSCSNICRLCNHLVISQSVTFTSGNIVINLPAGSYDDDAKYCIVVAQKIPTTATISSPVAVTIGTGTVLYPLARRDGVQATVCNIRTRTRYATRLATSDTGGTFRLLGGCCCAPDNSLQAVNGTAVKSPSATTSQSVGDSSGQ